MRGDAAAQGGATLDHLETLVGMLGLVEVVLVVADADVF
jgi:hypothetical protein